MNLFSHVDNAKAIKHGASANWGVLPFGRILPHSNRKNTEANDKAHDLNQKSLQVLDALAKKHGDFEATMANVTSEQEAGDVLHVATLEVAEELERAQKDQGRLQDDLDCSSDALTVATKEFSDCWAAHEATGAELCNAFRVVCNRHAAHEEICVEARKALHRTNEIKRNLRKSKKACPHTENVLDVLQMSTPGPKVTSTMALALWVEPCKPQPNPRTPWPDRESNEIKYLREATELIEEW